ncbi:MAG: formyltransferase family protein [Dehalococcoidia bacterium]|nr:formyltransferase family protein [Dehalococcoidia bacterium]
MYQVAWFSTGRGKGSRDLLTVAQEAIRQGQLEAAISVVFCSREPGDAPGSDQFIELVKSFGLPLVCFSSRRYRRELKAEAPDQWRLEYDREVMKRLEGYRHDLCVLAGYMLVVGSEMCRKYKMVNLHPAAPGGPKGTWQDVIWQLIEQKAQSTGVMMHLVTPELDQGPPVAYCTFSLRGEPFDRYWKEIEGLSVAQIKAQQGEENALFKLIRQRGVVREHPLVLSTINAFSQGRVRIEGETVVDAKGNPIAGYDLTEEIDRLVER